MVEAGSVAQTAAEVAAGSAAWGITASCAVWVVAEVDGAARIVVPAGHAVEAVVVHGYCDD